MDRIPLDDGGPSAGRRSLSRASTATSTTLAVRTPSASDSDSASLMNDTRSLTSLATTSDPLLVTSLSVTNWRTQYPRIGQFAMTPSEEVVAATPDGLVYFRRVHDHPSKPWSEARPFPPTAERLDDLNVTGLALHQESDQAKSDFMQVFCVAAGKLHAFSRSKDSGSTFAVDSHSPFAGSTVSGIPAVAGIKERSGSEHQGFCVIVPCPSGGILYTSNFVSAGYYSHDRPIWEPTSQLATHLGIVSAVSAASETVIKSASASLCASSTTDIIAACIAGSRLYSIEGQFTRPSSYSSSTTWKDPRSIRIQHPGEVTGNPVLLSNHKPGTQVYQLDLLVPFAEGGVFHFIRTATTPDEWHMIGRINFPTGIPIASSLACWRDNQGRNYHYPEFRAFIQCGGRLYLIKTSMGAQPWVGSRLYPVNGPGPFLH